MSLQPKQYLFLQVVGSLPAGQYLTTLLTRFKSELAEHDSWVNNQNYLKKAVIDCRLRIYQKFPDGENFIKRHYPDDFITTEEMQGHNIGLTNEGRFILRWKRADGATCNLRIASMIFIATRPYGLRAISFTIHGIDLVIAFGHTFRTKNHDAVEHAAIILRKTFATLEGGHLILELWTAVLKHLEISIPMPYSQSTKVWGNAKEVGCLSQSYEEKTLVKIDPSTARYQLPTGDIHQPAISTQGLYIAPLLALVYLTLPRICGHFVRSFSALSILDTRTLNSG